MARIPDLWEQSAIDVLVRGHFDVHLARKKEDIVLRSGGEHRQMEIVLVHWYIIAGREAELLRFWSDNAPKNDTPGYLDETLCEVQDQDEPGVTKFVNVARWRSREDFEQLFWVEPAEQLDFEHRLRSRQWLTPI